MGGEGSLEVGGGVDKVRLILDKAGCRLVEGAGFDDPGLGQGVDKR